MDDSEALNMLVSVSELQAHLHDAHWCVVDVRHDLFDLKAGMRAYAPVTFGAVFAGIDRDLSGKRPAAMGAIRYRGEMNRRRFSQLGDQQRYADRCRRAGRPVCCAIVVAGALART